MLNFSKTKIISIYLTFLFISLFAILNFIEIDKSFLNKKVNLGLDLQGGSYLLLEVDTSLLEKKSLQSKVIPLKKKLKAESIKFNNFIINDERIQFNIDKKKIDIFERIFNEKKEDNFNSFLSEYNAFELEKEIISNQVNITLSKQGIISIRSAAVNQSIEIVRRRIDEVGTKEPSILKRGNNRISVSYTHLRAHET